MATLEEEERNRILNPESEEDRKILMKVKSEEGKILELKKEFVAASQAALARVSDYDVVPKVKAAAQPAGKKKVLVKRLMTQAQIDFIRAMAAHPCPTRKLTEDQLAMEPKSFQDRYREDMYYVRNKMLAYHEALVDQQERTGYAVDESETEVTDDEDEDDEDDDGGGTVEN